MRRFFVETIDESSGEVRITGPEAGHIARVLRMGPGDPLILMDGKGKRFQARITSAKSKVVHALLEKSLPIPPRSPVQITLCQSLVKSNAMDDLVRKITELGADSLLPFISERSTWRPDSEKFSRKTKHWLGISQSETTLSDRDRPLVIHPYGSLEEMVRFLNNLEALKVIFWENEECRHLKEYLRDIPARTHKNFVGVVGPEGGFSLKEIDVALEAGFVVASLGNRILRAETAATAVVALVQYEWGDLG